MTENKELIFYRKNFIYDNGIVNFLLLLEDKYGENGIGENKNKLGRDYEGNQFIYFKLVSEKYDINIQLYNNYFKILGSETELNNLFIEIYHFMLEKGEIVYNTNNKRYYWDEENQCITIDNKVNVKGGCQYFGYLVFKKIEDLSYNNRSLTKNDIMNEIEKYNLENDAKVKENDIINGAYGVYIKTSLNDNIKKFISYSLDGQENKGINGEVTYNSKIHSFETGGYQFTDIISGEQKINILDSIIYQIGFRVGKYFVGNYNYYFYSDSLMDLFDIKNILQISDKQVENYDIEVNGETKTIKNNGNIDFYKSLGELNFYCNSENDNQLKILLYIFEIFKQLEYTDDDMYSFLNKNPSIYSFEETDLKTTLNYYQKINKLFNFFEKLRNKKVKINKIRDGTSEKKTISLENILFGNIFDKNGILKKVYNAKPDGKTPLILGKFTYNLLNFRSLRKIYKMTQEQLLKDKKGTLPEGLKEFENLYLEEIGKNKDIMLNELCYKVGNDIGRFLAQIDDSALIYRLRNVKNISQLKSFISELHFLILKKSQDTGLKKEVVDYINKLLEILNKDNYETIKDYLSIYIIQQYQKTSYARNNN